MFDALMIGNVSAAPEPETYAMATGRVAGTDLMQDRGLPARLSAISFNMQFQWEGAAKVHWFQTSTVTDDANVDNVIGGFVTNLFNYIVRELASHRNRLFAVRDTTLANSGTFNSFPSWMQNYSTAFCILRCLQSLLGATDFNYGMSLIAAAVNTQLPRLLSDLDRLMMFSAPKGYTDCLDRLCGVKALDRYAPPIIAGLLYPSGGITLDLTNNANIATLLGNAETCLSALTTGVGGISASAPADAQAISNIMGYAYGDTDIPLEKGVSYDEAEYWAHAAMVASFGDTTAAKNFSFPNSNVATPGANVIPMVVPREYSGPMLTQYLSLLRPAVYSVDPLAGIVNTASPNQVGLTANWLTAATFQNTMLGTYNQAGVFSNQLFRAAGTYITRYSDAFNILWWAPEATAEVTDYTLDARNYQGLDVLWIPRDWLIDETIMQLEEYFLEPLRISGGAQV